MRKVELENEDAVMLQQILESYLSDLRMEIADTDRMKFRDELKKRKYLIQHILENLKEKPN